MLWRTAGTQRPASAPTVMSKKRTGRQIFAHEDVAVISGQVGGLFRLKIFHAGQWKL